MRELNDSIARLEKRVEQMVIYLKSVGRGSAEAEMIRAQLLIMLHKLRRRKERRDDLEIRLGLRNAA